MWLAEVLPNSTVPEPMKSDISLQRRQRLIGIALMCGAVALFSCLDTTAKYLNHYMDTLQVVWARYAAGFALALILSNPVSRPVLMKTSRPWYCRSSACVDFAAW